MSICLLDYFMFIYRFKFIRAKQHNRCYSDTILRTKTFTIKHKERRITARLCKNYFTKVKGQNVPNNVI